MARAPTAELRMTALADTGVLNPSNGWRTCGAIAVNGWQMLGAEDIMAAVAAKDAAVKAKAEADETAEAITEAELKESSTDKDLNGADYKTIIKFVYLSSQQPGTRSSQNTKPKAVAFLAALSPPWRERIAPARAASTAALAAATSALAAAESGLACCPRHWPAHRWCSGRRSTGGGGGGSTGGGSTGGRCTGGSSGGRRRLPFGPQCRLACRASCQHPGLPSVPDRGGAPGDARRANPERGH